MTAHHNPALYEEPRNQPMKNIPPIPRESLFTWLEKSGRFHAHEIDDFQELKISEDLDDILGPELYAVETEEEEQLDG